MMKKCEEFIRALEGETVMSKRELFLGVTTALFAGVVLGMIFSPRKKIKIGNDNETNYYQAADEEED